MGLFTPDITRLEKENNIGELVKCLGSKRPGVRYRAFVALSGKENLPDENMNKLRGMSHDPDPWVKTIATLKFAGMGINPYPEAFWKLSKTVHRKSGLTFCR